MPSVPLVPSGSSASSASSASSREPAPAAAVSAKRLKKGAERRRSARRAVNLPADLIICPASSRTAPIRVTIRDISATGVGLVHSEPLPLGQKYVVKEPSVIPRAQPCLYTVVRSDPSGDGAYCIGLHASHLMGEEHAEKTGRAKTIAMAKLLIAAIAFGAALAVLSLGL